MHKNDEATTTLGGIFCAVKVPTDCDPVRSVLMYDGKEAAGEVRMGPQ